MIESKLSGRKEKKSWVSSAKRWWSRKTEEITQIRVLRGVVYMIKSKGPIKLCAFWKKKKTFNAGYMNLLTSSADSAMKKPCVLPSILTSGPGLMAMVHAPFSSERTSRAISNSFSLMKHILHHQYATAYISTWCTASADTSDIPQKKQQKVGCCKTS